MLPFVGVFSSDDVVFGPFQNDGKKQKVELFRGKSSTGRMLPLTFNLTSDCKKPFVCRFKLDQVREDQDGSRRGLMVRIEDEESLKGLTALDDAVVAHALKNSKEIFKKTNMTEAEVRMRYRPLVMKAREEDEGFSIKFKVKCKKNPTSLHLLDNDGLIAKDQGTLEQLSQHGVSVAPILNCYSLWFMGGGTSFGITVQAEEMVILPSPKSEGNSLSRFCSSTPILLKEEPIAECIKEVRCVEDEDTDSRPSKMAKKEEAEDNDDRAMDQ